MKVVIFVLMVAVLMFATASMFRAPDGPRTMPEVVANDKKVNDRNSSVDEAHAVATGDAPTSIAAGGNFIDGHGPLDIERWSDSIRVAGGACDEVMRPDTAAVIDVLLARYEHGETAASVLLAATYGCEAFEDQPDYQRERMTYWAHEAAGHDLPWGYRLLAMNAVDAMLAFRPGAQKPGAIEMERLRRTWHDALVRAYELTGDPGDIQALAYSYAHTFGPVFDEDKARYWLNEWAVVAPADQVADVGRKLIEHGLGGYRNSALGTQLLLQAARGGRTDAYLELLDFVAGCEGDVAAAGLPSARQVHNELVAAEGPSVNASIALASSLARAGNYNGAYEVLVEAQYVQQAVDGNDVESLQTLARVAEQVRRGNALNLADVQHRACDPESSFPEEQ